MKAYSKTVYDVLKDLKTNSKKGLTTFEAKKRLQTYGKNTLKEENKNSLSKKVWAQLSDFMIVILLLSATISFASSFLRGTADYIDSIIILAIVIVNATIGIIQESRAEKAIEALKKLSVPSTNAIRNEKQQKIPSEYVVPGDILALRAGDLVPADCRIIKSSNLKAEESSLTGETFAVEKYEDFNFPEDTPTADQKNMLFSSSIIDSGNALAVVTETGMNTQIGKIAHLINEEPELPSPLQKKLTNLGKVIGISTIIISFVIFILGILQGIKIAEMFMIAISLAVAAIPEGLPATITIVLANGVRKMALRGAIVRNLPAVETLGSANVICSDKTGTLTMNKMTLTEIRNVNFTEKFDSELGEKILNLSALCSEATISNLGKPHGSPTETAILKVAEKFTVGKNALEKTFPKIDEISFDSKQKYMVTFHQSGKKIKTIIKGAPEILIKFCSKFESASGIFEISPEILKKIKITIEEMAKKGLRVLAVAYKEDANKNHKSNLIFCGFLGITDPPRPETKNSVAQAEIAGIKSVMITGDHVYTAEAVAKELGILKKDQKSITGAELEKIPQRQLEKIIWEYSVFARVSPEHKVRIVKAFQANGAVVAMTGDGVNDAPALKAANIGCAMGKTGTDVAKSASDIILTDDNFATIVEAIRQGRGMFENIKKTIHFLLSTNIGEVLAVLLAFTLKLPPPLLAIHLLWINLVTDSFPALALGVDPVSKDIMQKKSPRSQNSIFSKRRVINIAIEGLFIAVLGILAFVLGKVFYDGPDEPIIARTMTFATLGICEVIHSFNVQSKKSLFKTGFFKNMKLIFAVLFCIALQAATICIPALTTFFKTKILNLEQWLLITGISLLPLLISEIEKFVTNSNYVKKQR